MTKKDFGPAGMSHESSDDRTLAGSHKPGSVTTQGQFQVWTKMSMARLKEDHIRLSELVRRLDDEQGRLLVDLKKRSEEQGESISILKDRHASAIKLITVLGGGVVSVMSSLFVWLLTR